MVERQKGNLLSRNIVKESNTSKMRNSLQVIMFQLSLLKQVQESQPHSLKLHIEVIKRNTLNLRNLMSDM